MTAEKEPRSGSSFLMISNIGEANTEGLTHQGWSDKSLDSDDSVIGMFGSGTKYAVLTCLRSGIEPLIYSGTNKFRWSPAESDPRKWATTPVMLYENNKSPQSIFATLGSGQYDWGSDIRLALREFVSNALDASNGKADRIKVELVDKPRAKEGTTRIFIPYPPGEYDSVQSFLSGWFLHFRPGGFPDKEGPIRKISPNTPARFFRRGVLISGLPEEHGVSLYDYNVVHWKLDEARKSDQWALTAKAGELLQNHPTEMAKLFRASSQGQELWEISKIPSWNLVPWDSTKKSALATALNTEFGTAVLCRDSTEAQLAKNNHKTTIIVSDNLFRVAESISANTVVKCLTEDERMQREFIPASEEALGIVEKWIGLIESFELTNKKSRPKVSGFRQHTSDGALYGFCRFDEGIFVNHELSGELLEQTIVEELAHWYSEEKDFTRNFQEWLVRLVVATRA